MRTSKRAYPDGKVPADFLNWMAKIGSVHLDESPLRTYKVKYVDSFPFRKGIKYKRRKVVVLDANNNRISITRLIRLT